MTMNYSQPGQNPSAPVNVIASGPVGIGELVTLMDSGKVAKTSTLLGIPLENNTTAGPANAVLNSNDAGNANYLSGFQESIAFLSDGNIAYAYSGDGSVATTNANFKIKTIHGGTLATVNLSTDLAVNNMKVLALPLSNRFVVFWTVTGDTTLRYAICANDGTIVKPAAILATISTGVQGWYSAAVLASGEFIAQYPKTASGGVCFKRFDSSGVLQGAETVVEAAALTSSAHATLACANGDFICYYYRITAATATYKFARYSATGAVVVALTSMATFAQALTTSGGAFHQTIVELSNGNIVFIATSPIASGNGYPYAHVYTAAGVLVRTIGYTDASYVRSSAITPAVATADGFAIASDASATTVYLRTFDNNGLARVGPVAIPNVGPGSTKWDLALFESGNSLTYVRMMNSADTSFSGRVFVTDLYGVLKGSMTTIDVDDSNTRWLTGAAMGPNKILALTYKYTTVTNFRTFRCVRCSVLGVALNSAADGGAVDVATKGTFNLPTTQNFGIGGAFDQRTAVVPGTRGVVVGRSAVLLGYT